QCGRVARADEGWQLQWTASPLAPPPDWFRAAHPDLTFGMQMVRNGRAYGIIYGPSGPDCAATVEIRTASGKSCGNASFSAGRGAGGCIGSTASRIGYDGTFVQLVPPPPNTCMGGVCSCTWHWWTGFFR